MAKRKSRSSRLQISPKHFSYTFAVYQSTLVKEDQLPESIYFFMRKTVKKGKPPLPGARYHSKAEEYLKNYEVISNPVF